MDFYNRLHKHLNHPQEFEIVLNEVIEKYQIWPELTTLLLNPEIPHSDFFSAKDEATKGLDASSFLIDYALLFWAAKPLYERYIQKNIPEWIFWNTISDMEAKWKECREIKGQWGTFVFFWYIDFYRLLRFGLGRMQYDISSFDRKDCVIAGHTVREGDRVYSCHIPSSGPLNHENIIDSLQKASEFFKSSPLVVTCNSWLLYPPVKEMVSPTSGIAKFIDLFHIIEVSKQDDFPDAWRIYGAAAELPMAEWPRDNSLRQGYISLLEKGVSAGTGIGVLIFENGKIL